jgi:two-component system chemotaxis sensor kinase CheA
MENVRAYTIINNLKGITEDIYYTPQNLIDGDADAEIIRKEGFNIWFKADNTYEEMQEFFMQTIFLRKLELIKLDNNNEIDQILKGKVNPRIDLSDTGPKVCNKEDTGSSEKDAHANHQSIISVQVDKLDKLMNLMGEIVIAEAMVTQNPDLKGLELENFQKAARQLHKITTELQDTVMSIRMVPLSTTFQKMHRIVRDMSKKLEKEVRLELIGEETEVDKNIIEHISDPLMHLVRNAIDHGIETIKEREASGKSKTGKVILEAKNVGSDVLILIKDDGKGLNKEKIIKRAIECDLLTKPEHEMSDREIYNLIFLPGFSTKDSVSEFSGRGVGMDVVIKNIASVGGTVSVECVEGAGSTVTLKIPLTLASIDGMNIKVGDSRYTIPTTAIKESFKPKEADLIKDPDENEMIMVRGECIPIIRLHQFYNVKTNITDFTEGILIMVENENKTICIFADELLGQQQVVVKMLPSYIKNTRKIQGLAGCTLLGDGNISLILDISGLLNERMKSMKII